MRGVGGSITERSRQARDYQKFNESQRLGLLWATNTWQRGLGLLAKFRCPTPAVSWSTCRVSRFNPSTHSEHPGSAL